MELLKHIQQAKDEQNFAQAIELIPYAKLIGIDCMSIGETLIFKLPKNEDNIGNPFLPAIHGGVIGGFMELSAVLHIIMTTDTVALPKVVDFSLDYLRPGRFQESFAECDVVRQGRKVVNVSVTAWQTRKTQPIATARAHFLLPSE